MDKKEARKLAKQIVAYLFTNNGGSAPVVRLVQETGDYPLNGPGWSQDAIRYAIEDAIAGRLPVPSNKVEKKKIVGYAAHSNQPIYEGEDL